MTEIIYNRKFEPLFKPPENVRYFIITGGRYCSKSYSASTAVCTLVNNQNRKALYTRYTLTSAKDSIIPEFWEKVELLNIEDYYRKTVDRIVGNKNRAIVFKGIKTSSGNQTAKLKSLKGFSIFVLDEAEEENDEDSFDKIDLSIRENDTSNIIILILNPTIKDHWIYKRFFENEGVDPGSNIIKGDTCYIHTSYLDTLKYIPQDYLNKINKLKQSNPDKYKHLIMGDWLDAAEGVIFENWEYGEFDESLPYGYGLDFGYFPDPDVLVKVAIDDKAKMVYVKQEFQLNNAGLDKITKEIKTSANLTKKIVADSAEPRLINDLEKRGITGIKPVKKYSGSVLAGIKLMYDYTIIVDPTSTEIGKEFNYYSWSDKKHSVPINLYHHRIDAIRYYMQDTIKQTPKRRGQKAL